MSLSETVKKGSEVIQQRRPWCFGLQRASRPRPTSLALVSCLEEKRAVGRSWNQPSPRARLRVCETAGFLQGPAQSSIGLGSEETGVVVRLGAVTAVRGTPVQIRKARFRTRKMVQHDGQDETRRGRVCVWPDKGMSRICEGNPPNLYSNTLGSSCWAFHSNRG